MIVSAGRRRRLLACRISMGIVTLLLAAWAARDATAALASHRDPAAALALSPHDPVALAGVADAQIDAAIGNPTVARRVEGLALSSLRARGINAPALRLLAFVADLKGQEAHARALAHLSERVSRRELGTQMWLIENAVRAGDVRGALRHYDLALRVSPETGRLLYPILNSALTNGTIRHPFVRMLRADPPWMPGFISHAVDQEGDIRPLAQAVIAAGGLPKTARYAELRGRLIDKLALRNEVGPVLAVARFLAPAALLRTLAPLASTTDATLAPLAWQFIAGDRASASLDGAEAISIQADAADPALVARKLLALEPGRWRLLYRLDAWEKPVGEVSIVWHCGTSALAPRIGGGRLIFGQDATLSVVVSRSCPAQLVAVMASGDGRPALRASLTRLELARIGGLSTPRDAVDCHRPRVSSQKQEGC